jgi:hypothetical protein
MTSCKYFTLQYLGKRPNYCSYGHNYRTTRQAGIHKEQRIQTCLGPLPGEWTKLPPSCVLDGFCILTGRERDDAGDGNIPPGTWTMGTFYDFFMSTTGIHGRRYTMYWSRWSCTVFIAHRRLYSTYYLLGKSLNSNLEEIFTQIQ